MKPGAESTVGGNRVSESLNQQEAQSSPCLAMTSFCEAAVGIASVFIRKYFQLVICSASTNSLKIVGKPKNI